MMWTIRIAVACVAVMIAAVGHVQAGPITIPPSLSPGDSYRLAFVTSTTIQALSPSIGTYNGFVTSHANSVPELLALPTGWRAIVSTSGIVGPTFPDVSAIANTSTDPSPAGPTGVSIYRLDGARLAINYDTLWGGGIAGGGFQSIFEDGTSGSANLIVWTGTGFDGNPDRPLGSGTPPPGTTFTFPTVGDSTTSASGWIDNGTRSRNEFHHVYAISDVLVVPEPAVAPVPEPTSLALLATGAVGLLAYRRRKRGLAV